MKCQTLLLISLALALAGHAQENASTAPGADGPGDVGPLRIEPPKQLTDLRQLLPHCAHPERAIITLPGGYSPQLFKLVDKLDTILLYGRGRVDIVHIGGSHVQADTYTAVLRHRLDSLNNGLMPARGLLFPFAAARTNNPLAYKTRYSGDWQHARCSLYRPRPTLGVAGIEVSTAQPGATIDIDMNPGADTTRAPRWTADRLTLLGRSETQRLTPTLQANGDTTVLTPTATPQGWTFQLPQHTRRFRLTVQRAKPGPDVLHVAGFLPDTQPDDGIHYHTIGVNGASVPSYLACERFRQELELLHPDLAIFAIGINDAIRSDFSEQRFIDNYGQLIRTFRQVNPDCALLFITNNDSCVRRRRRRQVNPNGPKQQHAFAQLATDWKGGLFDLFDVMGGLGSMAQWQRLQLAQKDKVHFTRAGYILVGELLADALIDFYLSQDPVPHDD